VIAITGVLSAAVAVFMRAPLQAYQDVQRRASVSDAADTAFALLKRDLQTALPNSVRVTNAGTVFFLEFLQTRTGGRYRAEDPVPAAAATANTCADGNANAIADENVLQFGVADTCFTITSAPVFPARMHMRAATRPAATRAASRPQAPALAAKT
jgi:MSHA biogenesis protein MshO